MFDDRRGAESPRIFRCSVIAEDNQQHFSGEAPNFSRDLRTNQWHIMGVHVSAENNQQAYYQPIAGGGRYSCEEFVKVPRI
jgi:hypothetical protein